MQTDANAVRALVTGGSGFFGHLLIAKLRAQGCLVRNLDLHALDTSHLGVEHIGADIRDANAVAQACRDIDVIYHNVAQQPLVRDKRIFNDVNYGGTNNLLTGALTHGVKKVIVTSSTSVFGIPKQVPIRVDSPTEPVEAYGRSKVACEKLCAQFVAKGLDVTIIRPRTTIGHGRLGIFQILFEWIFRGDDIPVLGSGDNPFQFIHASDLADATLRAAARPGPATYNIGTDRFGTMRDMLQALCAHAASGSRVKSVPMRPAIWANRILSTCRLSPLGAYHYLAYGHPSYFDISLAQAELGWQPQYSNVEMMIESYDWYVRNRDSLLRDGVGVSPNRSVIKQGMLGLAVRCLRWL